MDGKQASIALPHNNNNIIKALSRIEKTDDPLHSGDIFPPGWMLIFWHENYIDMKPFCLIIFQLSVSFDKNIDVKYKN